MLTIEDIRNPNRKSGFRYVGLNQQDDKPVPKPFQAYDPRSGGPTKKHRWKGPRRATAGEAAQDYCDYANGHSIVMAKLRNAGHAVRASETRDPEVEAALGVLRDARAQRQGKQGYVYCITDGEYVKIGYSVNPEARVGELQTGNGRPLSLLAKMPASMDVEREFHTQFIHLNSIGEWFKVDSSIIKAFDGHFVA